MADKSYTIVDVGKRGATFSSINHVNREPIGWFELYDGASHVDRKISNFYKPLLELAKDSASLRSPVEVKVRRGCDNMWIVDVRASWAVATCQLYPGHSWAEAGEGISYK